MIKLYLYRNNIFFWINRDYLKMKNNLFDGFYESIHCSSDEFIDIEMEDKAILDDLLFFIDNKNDIEVIYEYENINEYKKDVCDIFMQLYVERIIDELPLDITDKECQEDGWADYIEKNILW